jgi:hypothetical protein
MANQVAPSVINGSKTSKRLVGEDRRQTCQSSEWPASWAPGLDIIYRWL